MSPGPPHWGPTARIWGEGDVHHQVFPAKKITGRGNSAGSRPGQSTTDVPAAHAFITLEMRPSIAEWSRVSCLAPTKGANWFNPGHARLCRLLPTARRICKTHLHQRVEIV